MGKLLCAFVKQEEYPAAAFLELLTDFFVCDPEASGTD